MTIHLSISLQFLPSRPFLPISLSLPLPNQTKLLNAARESGSSGVYCIARVWKYVQGIQDELSPTGTLGVKPRIYNIPVHTETLGVVVLVVCVCCCLRVARSTVTPK